MDGLNDGHVREIIIIRLVQPRLVFEQIKLLPIIFIPETQKLQITSLLAISLAVTWTRGMEPL